MKKRRKKKSKLKILLFFILIIAIVLVSVIMFFINKEANNIKVTLVDNLDIDVNSEVKINSLIKDIKNGSIIDGDDLLIADKIGKKKVIIKLKNKDNKEEEYTFFVNIIDKEAPVIEVSENITITVGDEFDFISYVTVSDNYDKEFDIQIEGDYDNNTKGEYKLTYVVKDSSGNENRKDFSLVVENSKYKKMSDRTITTDNGYTLKIKNGVAYIDGILIVNKTYYLPEIYTPVNSYSTLSDSCAHCLEKEVMEAFNLMNADAKSIGLNMWIASGYRSYNTQKYLYNNYVSRDGVAAADTYSARAGHSEHQTGLAFDLNSVSSSFGYTNEGKWVNDNCYRYGFIIRYPSGKESITGYMYEPWHLRYVGKELAEKIYNDGDWLTLEEYFGITSKYEG